MRRTPHLLRDAVLLTLPILGLAIYLWIAALGSFWNAEVRCFDGELVRDLRVGTLRTMIHQVTRGLFEAKERRYLPLKQPKGATGAKVASAAATDDTSAIATATDAGIEVFDLRVDGAALDALAADFPASAHLQQKGLLNIGSEAYEVDANWRGQRMENYFFARKSWKLRTKKREFVDDQRVLNLTPLVDRLASVATFAVARACELPAPQTRLVHLYVNLEDEGIYLLEEQVDESFLRRVGQMPGDIFYGELFVPEVPTSSSWELCWNPYLWEKHDRWNKYSEEWRPWLSDLLDATCDPAPAGLDRLHAILDDSFALYYAILCYHGDQHVDLSHNHRIGLDLLAGKLSGMLWNPLINMPPGQGVETTANRLFDRLAHDPRFLDRVAKLIDERMIAEEEPRAQLEELERIRRVLQESVDFESRDNRFLRRALGGMRRRLAERHKTVRMQHAIAEVAFTQAGDANGSRTLSLAATAVASLRLEAIDLETQGSGGLELWEDRDFDGALGAADRPVARGTDRRLAAHVDGHRLVIDDADALVYVGRDFTASYQQRPSEGQDTFAQHREFTRLAALESRYVLRSASGAVPPRVLGLQLARTVGNGAVEVHEGPPNGFVATETVHPWRMAAVAAPRKVELAGAVELRQSLLLEERDTLVVAPGTQLRLGPGVSIQVKSPIEWRDVTVTRLDPARAFGVVALQGHGCDGSTLDHVTIDGGSEATIGYLYYSGMLSAHLVDRLTLRDSRFANNLLGDDTVRLGACHDLLLERVRVENANADAIDFDLCNGVVRDATVERPSNDGMDMMTCRVVVERLAVTGAGDKGISIGEGSHPELVSCTFRDCVTGIGIKDGSDPLVRDTLIEGCKTGVASYDKNWRYPGGGLGKLLRCTLRGNQLDVKIDGESQLTLDHCQTEGKFDVAKKRAKGIAESLIVLPATDSPNAVERGTAQ